MDQPDGVRASGVGSDRVAAAGRSDRQSVEAAVLQRHLYVVDTAACGDQGRARQNVNARRPDHASPALMPDTA